MDTKFTRRNAHFSLVGLISILFGFAMSAHAATFVVNSTADAPDASVGDGICADAQGQCTLRAAVMQANALSGTDTIDLSQISDPANPIILTIAGADETAQKNDAGDYAVVATHDASIGDLNITDSVDIVGAGPDKTIIEWAPTAKSDPATGDRVFHVEAVTTNVVVNISGVTIQNGVVPAPVTLQTLSDGTYYSFKRNGGGIAIGPDAAVSLVDPNAESGSSGDEGGSGGSGGDEGESSAVISSVALTNVRILDNQSGGVDDHQVAGGDGGGIYNAAPLTLTNVLVSGNTAAGNGGGIYNDAAMDVVDSTIGTMAGFTTPNTAEGGGGIFDTGMHTTNISGSSINGNTGVGGGGISARSLVVFNLVSSTINGNKATDVGGGVTTNGMVNLQNVTVSDNSAENDSTSGGAGLNAFGSGGYTFVNTLFANNNSTTGPSTCGCSGSSCKTGVMVSGGHNLANDNTCTLGATGDQPNTDAQLQPLGANGGPTETRGLLSASPAVDAGDNARCPNTDQRGSLRPADGKLTNIQICDIGAFELFIDRADLHVSRKSAPDRVVHGGSADVSIDFYNDANATADATGVVITTSALPAAYTLSSATVTTTGGTSDCAVDSNTRVVTCDVGTLAKGDTATLDLKGTAMAQGKMTFTVSVSATAPVDIFPDNNVTTVNIQVQGSSNLGMHATAPGKQPQVKGGNATFPFDVKNQGPDPSTNVRVLATFRNRFAYANMTWSDGAGGGGTCTVQPDGLSALCDCGTIASGGSVTGSLDLTPTSAGTTEVTFQVTTDDVDSDTSNDTTVVPVTIADATPVPPPPTPTTSSSGGGCVAKPGSPFDPTLLVLAAAGAFGIGLRRLRRAASRSA